MTNQGIVMQVDLDGRRFDIPQSFIDKYPESLFAKYLDSGVDKPDEPVVIDRGNRCLQKILDYSRDKLSIKFYQLSHIEIRKLLLDAKFFCIDDLVEDCERELTITTQEDLCLFISCGHLLELLAIETRLVIVLNLSVLPTKHNTINKIKNLVQRDKCLIVACEEAFSELKFVQISGNCYSFLYDPVAKKCHLNS